MTWNEPPPTQIVQAVHNPVDHFSSRQLYEGTINANLSWRFNLTELKFTNLGLIFDSKFIGGAEPSRQTIRAGFENQFGIDWIFNQTFVRLIIFNVTIKENGTFALRVATVKGPRNYHFHSKVQVDVVGELKVKSRNIYIERGYYMAMHGYEFYL